MDSLSNLIGIVQTEQISKLFQQKATEESELLEIGRIGILKYLLVDIWEEKSKDINYLIETGCVKVSNKEIYDRSNGILRQKGLLQVTSHEFKAYLTEFGFSDSVNRKKMKVLVPDENTPRSRLANIFTPQVLKKLEIEQEESAKEPREELPIERPMEVEN